MNYLKLFALCALCATAMTACGDKTETVAVTSVEITSTPSPLTLTVGGATGRVFARVLPADATDKTITWSVAPEGVVEIAADGTVTALLSGTVNSARTATITATAANGVKKTCSVTVSLPESITYVYTGTFTVAPGTDDAYIRENARIEFTISPDRTTADMIMVQARFTPQGGMPEMDITVPGVTVAKTAEGYSISGDGIVPTTVMGGQTVEVDRFTMTDFTGTITEDEMSWEMMCGTYPLTFEGTATAE